MSKMLRVVVLVVMVLSLLGCGPAPTLPSTPADTPSTAHEEDKPAPTAEADVPPTPEIYDVVTLGIDDKIPALPVDVVCEFKGFDKPQAGKDLVYFSCMGRSVGVGDEIIAKCNSDRYCAVAKLIKTDSSANIVIIQVYDGGITRPNPNQ